LLTKPYNLNNVTAMLLIGLAYCCVYLSGCQSLSSNDSQAIAAKPEKNIAPAIECVKAQKKNISPVVHCTGQVKPVFGKEYTVGVRLSGRILKVNVAPGEHVKAGQILGYVDSQQVSEIQAEASKAASRLAIARAHEEREFRVYQEELLRPKALIRAKTALQLAIINEQSAKRNFHRMETLKKEGIAAEKDYLQSKSGLERARLDLEQSQLEEKRESELFANKGLIKKDWQLAQTETQESLNELQTINEKLGFLGAESRPIRGSTKDSIKDSINSASLSKRLRPLVPIIAPARGTIVQQFVSPGEIVGPDSPIFSICDLRQVAISCEIPESDLSLVAKGLPVAASVTSYGSRTFDGKVDYVGERLDPKTRTVSVRAVIDNTSGHLKLNMFATIDIQGTPKQVIACPREAIHETGGTTVVYLRTGQNLYAKRVVQTGISSGDLVEITSGLQGGEDVVTTGGVLVKTKLSMEQRGDG